MLPTTLDVEDCEQEMELAILEGIDPSYAVNKMVTKERQRPRNNYEMGWVSDACKLVGTREARSKLSIGKRQKLVRNVSIYIAHKGGMSHRELGELYNLPHSRVHAIIKEFNEGL